MDDVFNRDEPKQEAKPAEPQQVDRQSPQTVEDAPEQSGADGAPTAPNTEKHVPLAALEDERSKRRDWKEKALRFEGELKAIREMQERQQQPQEPQQPQDPLQVMEQRFVNMTLNASERMARKAYGDEAVSKAFEKFRAAVGKNPLLQQQALNSGDPWDFVVQEGQKLSMLEEIGTDPKSYREKLKAEIMAELQQSPNQSQAPGASIPQSLATARSSAARSAPAFTGPQPFESLFKN